MTSLIPLYLKTFFKEDPIFKQTKVVYTVYNNYLDYPLPSNFAEKAKLDGIPSELLEEYSGHTYLGVSRGGIRLADAVTSGTAELNPVIMECMKQNNVDMIYDRNGEDEKFYIEYYDNLYKNILN
jgi:starch synthase